MVAKQSLRFEGFDTPERNRPKCADEEARAQQARAVTLAYMQGDVRLEASGDFDRYGRLLVRATELKKLLIREGLAKLAPDGKRQNWCD